MPVVKRAGLKGCRDDSCQAVWSLVVAAGSSFDHLLSDIYRRETLNLEWLG